MKLILRFASPALAVALLGLFAAGALAQSYPTKPIRFVNVTAPGGTIDIVARVVAEKLSQSLGQPVVVENRPGGGGTIAIDTVAKANPDGYTILAVSASHTLNPSFGKKLPYDPIKDFAPVTLMALSPYVLTVHPSVPANSVKELIALAKSKPGQLNYGSPGIGTAGHLAGELFKVMAGIDIVHIPYKGGPPGLTALLGGEVSMLFYPVFLVQPHHKTGRLRALAAIESRRSSAMPELPTIAESGLPGYEVTQWYGVLAPAGTPREIVTRLHTEIAKIVKLPEVNERLLGQVEPVSSTPEEFDAFIKAEIVKWTKVVKDAGIRID